jgi:hypothetical protein
MPAISMYNASIPAFIKMLNNLNAILDKASIWAQAKKIDEKYLMASRIAPDMLPFTKQIQIATDIVKGCAARLAGIDPPKYEDNESSFAELKARISKTIAFLETFTAQQIDNSEDKSIELKFGPNSFMFKGLDYLLTFANPNLYFHVTTAYAILRHNGLEIGKKDFLGA